MPTPDLDAYEAAFDRAAAPLDPSAAWLRQERVIRRVLRTPTRAVLWTVVKIGLCLLGAAAFGALNGYGIAFFLAVVVLRRQWKERQDRREQLAAVETAEDLRRLCKDQADRVFMGIVTRALLLGLLGLVYVGVGLVALALDRSPWPGVVAGGVCVVWAVYRFTWPLSRALRECRVFDDEEEGDDDDEDEDGVA